MPAIEHTCGQIIRYGEIPCPHEWLFISDVDYDRFFSGTVDAEELYLSMKAFLCCLLIGGVAVGYVQQTHENTALKIQKKELVAAIDRHAMQNAQLQKELDDCQSLDSLEQMARHLGVDLEPPRPGQVIELELSGPSEPLMARSRPPSHGRRERRDE